LKQVYSLVTKAQIIIEPENPKNPESGCWRWKMKDAAGNSWGFSGGHKTREAARADAAERKQVWGLVDIEIEEQDAISNATA
jgi:hypothetical protein